MNQLPLPEIPHRRHGQRAPERQTSRDARPSRERRESLERQVLAFIRDRGSHGATDDELIEALGTQSVRPRRIKLEAARDETGKPKYIKDSKRKRKTRAGRNAIVWIATGETG